MNISSIPHRPALYSAAVAAVALGAAISLSAGPSAADAPSPHNERVGEYLSLRHQAAPYTPNARIAEYLFFRHHPDSTFAG
jgi:hypothetical protein